MDFDNLDLFTNNEFSTVAVVNSATSSIVELSGIFDSNYQDFGEYSQGRKFCFQVQTAEADGLKRGDRLTVYGNNYQITSLEPKHDGLLVNIVLKQDFS